MNRKMFVYQLPYANRKELCQILDSNDKWGELGGSHMGFEYTYLQYLRRRDSPTDELLTAWGNQNHTVNDLFVLLSKMQHYRAMSVLKEFVEEKFLHLLPDGEEFMDRRASINKHCMNPDFGRNDNDRFRRPSCVMSPPQTYEDNKDLGLDGYNLNFESATVKVTGKVLGEEKIKNKQVLIGNKLVNLNGLNLVTNGSNQAAARPNHNNYQMQPANMQKPAGERRLSTSSVSSSVVENCMPVIDYQELVTATNNWDSSCIVGRGGFGIVYKGTWKNTLVAIKKLDSQVQNQEVTTSQLVRELKSLNTHRHDNILSLYAFSLDDNVACLVYQYMANGSLEDRLLCKQKTPPLNWLQRLNIMTGTARGIQFLHSLGNPPLVHGDIKSANILLDGNFEPRLGDFGLAREGPLQQFTHVKVSRVHGTRPYLPDEFLRGRQFSVKIDTYSFGVVLFEVATGLRAFDESRKEKFLKDHIESIPGTELHRLADPLAGPDLCASAAGLLTLGLNCVRSRRQERPDMTNVLNDVNKLFNNYKGALRVISLARQRSLTPTNPLEIQVAFEMQRSATPSPNVVPCQQPPLLVLQIPQQSAQVSASNSERPIELQLPPADGNPSFSNLQEQMNKSQSPPEPLNTSPIPLVTLLGSPPEYLSNCEAGLTNECSSSLSAAAPDNYLPLVPELMGLKLAGPSPPLSTSNA